MLLALVPSQPAAGADLAAGKCSSGGSSNAYSTYTASKGCDGDDTTQYVADGSAGYTCWLVIDLGTVENVGGYRVVSRNANTSESVWWHTSTGSAPSKLTCTSSPGSEGWTQVSDTPATASGSCGDPCLVTTATLATPVSHRYWAVGAHGDAGGVQIFTAELLAGGPTEVDITEYIYNLTAFHPPFLRRYTWEWVAEPYWSGTWALTDSDDTLIAGTFRPEPNHIEQVDIHCPVVCGDDTYLLTINDATNDRVAYYEIDGDATGQLVDNIAPPRLTGVTSFCFQATSAQCDAVVTSVGVVKVTYTFTGTSDYEYDISAGQLSSVAAAPAMASVGVSGAHVPGTYSLFIPAADVDTDGPPHAVLLITAASGSRTFTVGDLNFATGGIINVIEPPDPAAGVPTSCGQFDIVCGLRSLFNVGQSAILAAFNDAYNSLIQRQPFAFLFGSAAAAGAQITRAQGAVANSDDCDGVHFTMPSLPPVSYNAFGATRTVEPKYYAFNGNVPSPTPFQFSAVRCADLEPWGGTDWWQSLRTIMGPALVMGYAFQLFRRYEVKPQLNG